jgi:hypothetical protein
LLAIKQILLSDADGKVLVLDTRASFPIYRLQLMLEEEPWMDQDQRMIFVRASILIFFSVTMFESGIDCHYTWLLAVIMHNGKAAD